MMATPVVLAVLGVVLLALAGVLESALVVMARSSVRAQLATSQVRSQAVSRLLDQPFRTWAALGAVELAGAALVGAAVARSWVSAGDARAALLVIAALALPAVYVIPRALATRAIGAAAAVAGPMVVLRALLSPATLILERLAQAFGGNGEADLPIVMAFTRADDPRAILDADDSASGLEEGEREMIVSIFELGDTKVREVMVPRIDIVAIPMASTLDEALDTILAAGHSRIPVYAESIDDIAGLLYAKDLLKAFRDRDFEPDLNLLLRDAYFVPDSKPVDELLAELKGRKVHMAVVVDEYGGTAGLVTIEDLLEEIVGEIQDEYDTEERRVELVSEDEGLFHAGVDIDDVNRMMDIQLPTDEVDTLAGLIYTRLGKVPEVGEKALFDDAAIEVLSLTGRRIQRVRVVRQRPLVFALTDDAVPEPPSTATEPPAR
jgi:CBS domain containing-hemolysin-like protein